MIGEKLSPILEEKEKIKKFVEEQIKILDEDCENYEELDSFDNFELDMEIEKEFNIYVDSDLTKPYWTTDEYVDYIYTIIFGKNND
jgi:acyl carrier protein